MMRMVFVLGMLSLVLVPRAYAHKPSDSYLTLDARGDGAIRGHWDIALRDLDADLTLDANGDGVLRWAEVMAREPALIAHAARHLTLTRSDAACTLSLADADPLTLVAHSDGRYARLSLTARCDAHAGALQVRYGLFFARDAQHRGIVQHAESESPPCVLTTSSPRCALHEDAPPGVAAMIESGVVHIVTGYDHVLFLLAMMLPLLRARSGAEPRAKRTLTEVAKLVTAFTLAHSLTLGLAALGVVRMSASVIEPAIAASVALAALDVLWPFLGAARWSVAFALGLLHGFGFASVLGDLGLSGAPLVRALLGFNLGVELGQLGLVLLFVPIGLAAVSRRVTRGLLLHGGSASIALLSLVWLVQRVRGE
ncbi:MAG: HupE/UreJ family protein [Polyangiales bacterium]